MKRVGRGPRTYSLAAEIGIALAIGAISAGFGLLFLWAGGAFRY